MQTRDSAHLNEQSDRVSATNQSGESSETTSRQQVQTDHPHSAAKRRYSKPSVGAPEKLGGFFMT
ncbi:MAG: hypothetical protein U0136_08105 [Bdellovibrionota bacterium]